MSQFSRSALAGGHGGTGPCLGQVMILMMCLKKTLCKGTMGNMQIRGNMLQFVQLFGDVLISVHKPTSQNKNARTEHVSVKNILLEHHYASLPSANGLTLPISNN